MALVEIAVMEARMLHRQFGAWPLAIFTACALGTRVQEPYALRRQGLGFYWDGVEAGLVVLTAVTAWAWCLARRNWDPGWGRDDRIALSTVIRSLSIYTYVMSHAAVGVALALLVDGAFGTWSFAPAGATFSHLAILALPVAGIAPGLAAFPRSIAATTILWITAWLVSFQWSVPFPTFLLAPTGQHDAALVLCSGAVVLACAAAAVGSWAFSLGVTRLRG